MEPRTQMSNLWYLSKVNLLSDVDRVELERVARLLLLKEFARGETFLLNASNSERVYFLFKGKIGVARIDPSTGKEVMLYLVRPGEPFGALSTSREESESVAKVLAASLVGYVEKADFLALARKSVVHPRLEKLLESRLVRLENRLEDLAFCDVTTRLARLLLRLSDDYPGECPKNEGALIELNLTQQEIGNLIAASREITSLTLNEFRRDGWVARHGRRLCIHDRAALEETAAA
jgi:CRP/FNR family cyclic AMP-dependent transcriptional regulator